MDPKKGEFVTFEAGTDLSDEYSHLLEPTKDVWGQEVPARLGDHVFEEVPDHNAPAPLVHPQYEELSRDQLREEVEKRNEGGANIQVGGTKKSDYIQALEQHDGAHGPGNERSSEDITAT